MVEELLGRPLMADEIHAIERIENLGSKVVLIISRMFQEVHAAGLVRGMSGRAGDDMMNESGWIPVDLNQGDEILWKH